MHADGGGLYLQVTKGDASRIYRFWLNGRAREMGLGSLALFGLQGAWRRGRNAKHAAQWEATLATYAEPILGALPVQVIDTALVMKVLQQDVGDTADQAPASLWSAKPETASRLRGRIESMLDWAKVRGYREGENPARWRGHLSKLLPARSKVRKVEQLHRSARTRRRPAPRRAPKTWPPRVAWSAAGPAILASARADFRSGGWRSRSS
jgi:integrase-like protein